ncbi:hypothetical protein AVI54_16485 (plasmid) [Piscirickettsia salmonis]|uniref:Pentapeptide repeats family protein n=1 Tax=Piscirickettsia salmonis TaxID=1238 RepID=A0AAC8VL48_PISSA|nr:pentapeptide repeat-containing protein [Piscirickettsia salmonis]AKP74984.1 hypothetical protein PSLF89_1p224 [Piscirickettsia salmonis LF-89 = ATCC VR-1361]ALB24563.1 pentapeptide repeats family protein [Piscirickettsia salmonis]APS65405.1 hypothetical protein AVI54_16485 [Piscirickettsia salmonis]APS84847.1 hypothetical protein AVM71_17330 [Piscirickettsia salmonis]
MIATPYSNLNFLQQCPNLSYANLSKANLSSMGWGSAIVAGAAYGGFVAAISKNIAGMSVGTSVLTGATVAAMVTFTKKLEGANVKVTNLFGANLSGANLTHTNCTGAYFIDTDLTNAKVSKTDLKYAMFSKISLEGTGLNFKDLVGDATPKSEGLMELPSVIYIPKVTGSYQYYERNHGYLSAHLPQEESTLNTPRLFEGSQQQECQEQSSSVNLTH